jgi:hypothetical protein
MQTQAKKNKRERGKTNQGQAREKKSNKHVAPYFNYLRKRMESQSERDKGRSRKNKK